MKASFELEIDYTSYDALVRVCRGLARALTDEFAPEIPHIEIKRATITCFDSDGKPAMTEGVDAP